MPTKEELLKNYGKLKITVTRKYVPLIGTTIMKSYSKTELLKKYYFCDFYTRCGYVDGKFYYGDEAASFGDVLLGKETENKSIMDSIFSKIYECGEKLRSYSEELRDKDYSGETFEELLVLFRKFSDMCIEFAISLMGFNIQYVIEDRLRKILAKRRNPGEDLSILTYPMKENFAALEQKNLLKIGIMIKENKIKNFKDLTPEVLKKIKEHVREYGWINARGGRAEFWNEKDIFARIKELKYDFTEKLAELENFKVKAKENTESLLKELKADDEIRHLVKIAKELVYFRTYRTDYLNKAFADIRPLIESISKHRKMSYTEMLYLLSEEINENKEVSKQEIKQRMKNYFYATLEPQETVFFSDPKEIKRWEDKYFEEPVADSDEIKGTTAFGGKVKGKVKIVIHQEDTSKVERGDILVSPMTTPNFIVAMEKAAAFVTDEGGMLCHAAIVSREMEKPCIIGTQTATRVLKDGDLVEVDADEGVIKRLEK